MEVTSRTHWILLVLVQLICASLWGCSFDHPDDFVRVVGLRTSTAQRDVEIYGSVLSEGEAELPQCLMELQYCTDFRRLPPRPSYCTYTCDSASALRRAFVACKAACGEVRECEVMWNSGRC